MALLKSSISYVGKNAVNYQRDFEETKQQYIAGEIDDEAAAELMRNISTDQYRLLMHMRFVFVNSTLIARAKQEGNLLEQLLAAALEKPSF